MCTQARNIGGYMKELLGWSQLEGWVQQPYVRVEGWP